MSKGAAHTADLRSDLQHDRITVSLTNATLTTPTISGASLSGSTTVTGATLTSPTISGATITGSDITGSTIPSPKTSGGLYDTNGAAILDYGSKTTPVNNLRLTQGAAGEAVTLSAVGASAAIDLDLVTKSTGVVKFNGVAAPTTAAQSSAISAAIGLVSAGTTELATPQITTSINDSAGNELIKVVATASAVNEVTLTNAITGNRPVIAASGGDADVSLEIAGKGSGSVIVNGLTITGSGAIPAIQVGDGAPSTAGVIDAAAKSALDAIIATLQSAGILA